MNRLKSMYRGERGAEMIELALVSPLLIVLFIGVVDFGRVFHHYIIYTNASREGARFASRFPHLETRIQETAVQEAAGAGVPLVTGDVTVGNLMAPPGAHITVTVQHTVPLLLGGIVGINNVVLNTSTEMVVFGLDAP